MAVYLIHFARPYRHAGHYTGYADDVNKRLAAHRQGRGARLLEVVAAAGIAWQVARVWPEGDRALERQLKRRHRAAEYCPICMQERILDDQSRHSFARAR